MAVVGRRARLTAAAASGGAGLLAGLVLAHLLSEFGDDLLDARFLVGSAAAAGVCFGWLAASSVPVGLVASLVWGALAAVLCSAPGCIAACRVAGMEVHGCPLVMIGYVLFVTLPMWAIYALVCGPFVALVLRRAK